MKFPFKMIQFRGQRLIFWGYNSLKTSNTNYKYSPNIFKYQLRFALSRWLEKVRLIIFPKVIRIRVQAFSVALLCLPLNTFFEDTFPGKPFGTGRVWRHILTPHFGLPPHWCLTPHFDAALFHAHFRQIGGATTFAPDATFWHRIVWRHISIISEAPPHLCPTPHFHLTPHLDPRLETSSFFPPDFGFWNGIPYRVPFGMHVSGCCNWVGPCCLH